MYRNEIYIYSLSVSCPVNLHYIYSIITIISEPGYRSPYSDWLRARRPRDRSSSAGRVKNFLLSTSSRPALESTQPPIKRVTQALSPGVKRQGRETDHSPPTGAEVKKMWIYTSALPYASMA
jgi:hypothetical protein